MGLHGRGNGWPFCQWGIDERCKALDDRDRHCAAMIRQLLAEDAAKQIQIDQLEQDLSDMRDNAESAYRRGYWAGGNGQ